MTETQRLMTIQQTVQATVDELEARRDQGRNNWPRIIRWFHLNVYVPLNEAGAAFTPSGARSIAQLTANNRREVLVDTEDARAVTFRISLSDGTEFIYAVEVRKTPEHKMNPFTLFRGTNIGADGVPSIDPGERETVITFSDLGELSRPFDVISDVLSEFEKFTRSLN